MTLCSYQREPIFGNIHDKQIFLSEIGKIIHHHWHNLTKYYIYIILDEFIIMPNHIHGIIHINSSVEINQNQKPLSEIIRSFKTFSAREINKKRNALGVPIWQRNYWERIIRDEAEYDFVRHYIAENPANWTEDKLYT